MVIKSQSLDSALIIYVNRLLAAAAVNYKSRKVFNLASERMKHLSALHHISVFCKRKVYLKRKYGNLSLTLRMNCFV